MLGGAVGIRTRDGVRSPVWTASCTRALGSEKSDSELTNAIVHDHGPWVEREQREGEVSVLEWSDVEGVGVVRMARTESANAIDAELLAELRRAVQDHPCPVGVIASAGHGAFCGGADLRMADADRATLSDGLYGLYRDMVESPVTWIAAVAGAAVGAGAQIALACDIRIAGPRARFRFAGPGHGLAVGGWGLPTLVGRGRTMEICLTMRDVDAGEAQSIGLVERVAEDALGEALRVGAQLLGLDPGARSRLKRQVVDGLDLVAALERERVGNSGWKGGIPG